MDGHERCVALEFMDLGNAVRRAHGPFEDGDAARRWSLAHLPSQPPYIVFVDDPDDHEA